MGLAEALSGGTFVVTGEVTPPKGVDTRDMVETAKGLVTLVDAVNVTDNPSARMQMSSLGGSAALAAAGIEPVFQLTCRDRNRIALQSELLTAWSLGIRNVLCLTGDHVMFGDHPAAKPVFDLDAVQLLQVVGSLNAGRDMADKELKGAPSFFAGAAAAPEAEPWEAAKIKFEKKVAAGATWFQTQAIFDFGKLDRFMQVAAKRNVKVLAGLILLKSVKMVEFLNQYVPGVFVPQEAIDRLAASDTPIEVGVDIAVGQVKRFKDMCDGVHMMVMGAEARIPEILERAGVER